MKKLLYLCLAVAFIFTACSKDDDPPTAVTGCTDSDATNYNANATSDNGTCEYDISGVWQTTSAVLNGTNILGSQTDLIYIWPDGDMGTETYDATGYLMSYALGQGVLIAGNPNTGSWTGMLYNADYPDGTEVYLNWTIDLITNNNNMTWRYVNFPTAADTYVKTLVRSTTYSLSDWKKK